MLPTAGATSPSSAATTAMTFSGLSQSTFPPADAYVAYLLLTLVAVLAVVTALA